MEATVPRQMTGWKKTEAMPMLLEQAEETLHGGHGATSDGGLEEDQRQCCCSLTKPG